MPRYIFIFFLFVLAADAQVLAPISVCRSSGSGLGAAETLAYDEDSKKLFVTNAEGSADIFDLTDPATPQRVGLIKTDRAVNSVAVYSGLVALACEGVKPTDPGEVRLFNLDGSRANRGRPIQVGAMPDMLGFTPDGGRILTANEGEAVDGIDPMGSISLIDMATRTARSFDLSELDRQKPDGIRVFPGKTPSRDLEPEYIACTADGKRAVVCFQEGNAWGLFDLEGLKWIRFGTFGLKSWAESRIDTSDKDGGAVIRPAPGVVGMRMPDTIVFARIGGVDYLFTANEGDARDELKRAADLPTSLPAVRLAKSWYGRLKVSSFDGDVDGDGRIDVLHSYGGRSFSIWALEDDNLRLVFDSGDDFERITAAQVPNVFNSDSDELEADKRSDDKGPEPEALAIGTFGAKTLAFIGLERTGGIMMYNVTDPKRPAFVSYHLDRRHLGPEAMKFVPAGKSPNGKALLIVANEVSGTTVVYEVRP